jgi:hypothetical protein
MGFLPSALLFEGVRSRVCLYPSENRNAATSEQNQEVRPSPTRNKARADVAADIGANPLKSVGCCAPQPISLAVSTETCTQTERDCQGDRYSPSPGVALCSPDFQEVYDLLIREEAALEARSKWPTRASPRSRPFSYSKSLFPQLRYVGIRCAAPAHLTATPAAIGASRRTNNPRTAQLFTSLVSPQRGCTPLPTAASGKADDHAHRPRRIGLRPSDVRHRRQRGGACCEMQELATGKFHGAPSLVFAIRARNRTRARDANRRQN